jgi:site-specific recombinase XerD
MDDRAARVRVSGPLTQHAEGFRVMLAGRGYAPSSAAGQLQVMAHLSRWLAQQGRSAGDVTPTDVEQFLLVRKGAGYRRWLSARGVAPLLEYLEAAGLIVPAVSPGPLAPDSGVLAGYRDYLVTERGLAASTIRNYLDAAMLLAAQDGMRLDALTAGDVTRFVLAQCRNCSAGSATVLVTGLRSLLRYLHLAGFTPVSLADAVPSAASASPLPEATGPGQASRLLRSCDRGTAAGLRDYAVLVLLVRLGLRVGEVAAMQLGDIDWRAGQLTIRGKGSRLDQLPLPADAGQAVAAWLRGGRPGCSCRQVFTTLLAPLGPLSGKSVSAIVKRAGRRAGLAAVTAHRLRHGAATGLLRAGASLPEVAQVLRHASMLNTARYARVDHAALSAVARPWPGAAR